MNRSVLRVIIHSHNNLCLIMQGKACVVIYTKQAAVQYVSCWFSHTRVYGQMPVLLQRVGCSLKARREGVITRKMMCSFSHEDVFGIGNLFSSTGPKMSFNMHHPSMLLLSKVYMPPFLVFVDDNKCQNVAFYSCIIRHALVPC